MGNVEYPPLSEVRKNLRIAWYRCPIEHTTLKELSHRSDVRGLFQAVGHLALWAATGLASYL